MVPRRAAAGVACVGDDQMIDEAYVAQAVRRLRAEGLPATEGYYLVVLSPLEARDLVTQLATRSTKPARRYKHPPIGLTASAQMQGHTMVCVLGDALVVAADHTRQPRCSGAR